MRKIISVFILLALVIVLSGRSVLCAKLSSYEYKSGTVTGQSIYQYKSPGTALLFSLLLVGGGQFYNEEVGKGFLMLGLDAASWFVYLVGIGAEAPGLALLGFGGMVGVPIWSMIDAYVSAERINRQYGLTFEFRDETAILSYKFSF